MTQPLHPRAAAFEKNEKRKVCEKSGHRRRSVSWYSRDTGDRPCLRCGDPVPVKIDWDGHP